MLQRPLASHVTRLQQKLGTIVVSVGVDMCKFTTCNTGCRTKNTATFDGVLVEANATAFVGVNAKSTDKCECPVNSPAQCHHGLCHNGGVCHNTNPGFFCECRNDELKGLRCQGTTRSFSGNGYAWYKNVPACTALDISLQFLTSHSDGLLLYNGPMSDSSDRYEIKYRDYILRALRGGQVVLEMNINGQASSNVTVQSGPLNDGKWHDVHIRQDGRYIELVVNGCRYLTGGADGQGTPKRICDPGYGGDRYEKKLAWVQFGVNSYLEYSVMNAMLDEQWTDVDLLFIPGRTASSSEGSYGSDGLSSYVSASVEGQIPTANILIQNNAQPGTAPTTLQLPGVQLKENVSYWMQLERNPTRAQLAVDGSYIDRQPLDPTKQSFALAIKDLLFSSKGQGSARVFRGCVGTYRCQGPLMLLVMLALIGSASAAGLQEWERLSSTLWAWLWTLVGVFAGRPVDELIKSYSLESRAYWLGVGLGAGAAAYLFYCWVAYRRTAERSPYFELPVPLYRCVARNCHCPPVPERLCLVRECEELGCHRLFHHDCIPISVLLAQRAGEDRKLYCRDCLRRRQ
ncbi:unnamed protein product, partial [Mesorhabditis spiculigera]